MKKLLLALSGLLLSANALAVSVSCPITTIVYDGAAQTIAGWNVGGDPAPKAGTYLLAGADASVAGTDPAECVYTPNGLITDPTELLLDSPESGYKNGSGPWAIVGDEAYCIGASCMFDKVAAKATQTYTHHHTHRKFL